MNVSIRHKQGGDISLDDCASFNKPMSEALDASHLFEAGYVLEISSPGIGDYLLHDRDYKTFKGFPVEVIFKDEANSEFREVGLLNERSNEHIQLNIKGKMNRIPRKNVIGVRLTTQSG